MNKYEIKNIEKHRKELIIENIKLKAVIEKLLIDKKALQEQLTLTNVGCTFYCYDETVQIAEETGDEIIKCDKQCEKCKQ